jgi:hypothetical protein
METDKQYNARRARAARRQKAALIEAGTVLRRFYDVLQEVKTLKQREARALGELLDDVARDAMNGNYDTQLAKLRPDLSGWSLNDLDVAEGLRLFVDSSFHDTGWTWRRLEEIT